MRLHRATVVGLGLVALTVAGCGSSGSASHGSTSGNGTESSGSSNGSGFAVAAQQDLFKGTTFHSPPTTSPPPAKDKSVWVFSCGQSIKACSVQADGAVEAAKAIGWNVTLYDTKGLQSSLVTTGVRAAIAAKADALLVYSLDCQTWPASVRLAQNAGMKIVAGESLDCTNPDQPRLDSVVSYTQGDFPEWFRDNGVAQADNVIAGRQGKAKIIYVHQSDVPSFTDDVKAGVVSEVKKCGDCQIADEVDFTNDDIGPGLQQKIEQAIVKHPEANAMIWDWDFGDSGAIAALRASSNSKKILVAFGQGYPETINAVRSGQITGVGVGIPEVWESYAMVDNLNRLFNGQKPVSSGIGLQSFDLSHNFPKGDEYEPPIDFKPIYLKAWGTQ